MLLYKYAKFSLLVALMMICALSVCACSDNAKKNETKDTQTPKSTSEQTNDQAAKGLNQIPPALAESDMQIDMQAEKYFRLAQTDTTLKSLGEKAPDHIVVDNEKALTACAKNTQQITTIVQKNPLKVAVNNVETSAVALEEGGTLFIELGPCS